MLKRLELFLKQLTDEELHLVELALLQIANHGESTVVFPANVCEIADMILNY